MNSPLLPVVDGIIHVWYPNLCVVCERSLARHEKYICLSCAYNLPETHFHKQDNNPAMQVFWGRLPLQQAASFLYFEKAAGVQRIMHYIKYKGGKHLARVLGERYGHDLGKNPGFRSVQCIIPVPLHQSKLVARGYNQSEWFGMGLSDAMHIPLLKNGLVRTRKSETQTKKSRYKRWENVSDIFAVPHPAWLVNKHILLVDDVVTTGATLEACAQSILALNCGAKISMATLAFAT